MKVYFPVQVLKRNMSYINYSLINLYYELI